MLVGVRFGYFIFILTVGFLNNINLIPFKDQVLLPVLLVNYFNFNFQASTIKVNT